MRGFVVTGVGRVWVLSALLALVGGFLLVAERAGADGPEGQDESPVIASGSLSPGSLPYEGGNVQISAVVTDDFGVSTVYAQVYGPNGNQYFQLFEGGGSTYYGTLEVPPNNSEFPVEYEVEIQAYDTNNAYSATTIGGVQVEGAPQFDEPPYVSNPQLTPQALPAEGGAVTLSADATDNRSVSAVFATIFEPGGGTAEVTLDATGTGRFEGTFTAPANPGPLAAEYIVEIAAQDDIGQESRVFAGNITVQPPASAGTLRVRPTARRFGRVPVEGNSQRFVFVRAPRQNEGEIEATVLIAGSADFTIAGAPAEGLHFSLAPGERLAVPVQFQPGVRARQEAVLEIVRDDGEEPGLSVALSGRGSPRRWPTWQNSSTDPSHRARRLRTSESPDQ